MSRKFTISILISAALCALFLVLAFNAILSQNKNTGQDFIFLLFFVFVYGFILLQSFVCWRIKKSNQQNTVPASRSIILGKIISITAFLFGLILILCAIAGSFSFENYASKNQLRFKPLFILTIAFVTLSGLVAIFNCIFYFKAVKQNKLIVNSVINTIGENTSQ